jgi:hypothetical protein
MKFLVIDGCPCPDYPAPYVHLVLRRAGLTASSIYRGDDPAAKPILHRHGKHTQRELSEASPAQRAAWGVTGTPNRAGFSSHELRSDDGEPLADWHIGIDAGPNTDENRRRLRAAAHHYGLEIEFPYDAVVEYHHFRFKTKPHADGRHLTKRRVVLTRAKLRLAR